VTQCKKCRSAGEKLFLKGEQRCNSPKCTMVKKPYPPGIHGKQSKRKKIASEYGIQLKEKQKLKSIYGLREKQLKNYILKALSSNKVAFSKEIRAKKEANTADLLIQLIESRIDNALFKAGFGNSRAHSRQLVSHGHILINNKKMTVPSYLLKVGDRITLKTSRLQKETLQNIDLKLKKHKFPNWVKVNKDKKEIEIISLPTVDENKLNTNINSIIEFYLR
jgi:small subunit ribosomal protein S4